MFELRELIADIMNKFSCAATKFISDLKFKVNRFKDRFRTSSTPE